jgi:hypothetical protein
MCDTQETVAGAARPSGISLRAPSVFATVHLNC